MNKAPQPIQIDAQLLALLSPDVVRVLSWGQRFELPGKMVWHAWGEEENHTVVLLHGGSDSWTHWIRNIAPLVISGHRVLAVDLPGFGDSELPVHGGDADALVAPLHEAWQHMRRHNNNTLLGFSFGGMTAALWLAAHPADAQSLVMVGAPGFGLASPRRIPLKGWRHLATPELQAQAHRHNLLGLMLYDADQLDALAMRLHILNVARDRMTRRRLSSTPVLVPVMPQIQCPVHAIYGEHDAFYLDNLPEVEAMYRRITPRLASWQLLQGSGHWVQYETPDVFESALQRALQQAKA
jgi:pimeloyl-ACP methyl ester carboxylesterase